MLRQGKGFATEWGEGTSSRRQEKHISHLLFIFIFVLWLDEANGLARFCLKRLGLELCKCSADSVELFTSMAISLFRTPDSIASPCSVKAWGRNFVYLPLPTSKIPIWNLRESHSTFVNWNIKSDGKRLINVMCQKAPTSLFLICFPCLNRFSYLCYRCRRRA